MDVHNDVFLPDLEYSRPAVYKVYQWLKQFRGIYAYVPPQKNAPTRDEFQEYTDEGDIWVYRLGHRGKLIVEVKHLHYDFTDEKDWPFPDYIVMRKDRVDLLDPYVIYALNPPMTHWGKVYGRQKNEWTTRWVNIKKTGEVQEMYISPTRKVIFELFGGNNGFTQ